MTSFFLVHYDYKKKLIKHYRLYSNYILLMFLLITVLFVVIKFKLLTFYLSSIILGLLTISSYVSIFIIFLILFILWVAPKGKRLNFILKDTSFVIILEGSVFLISLITLRVLLKEIRSQFYTYRFVWMIAIWIPVIMSIIKYYKKKFNYLYNDSNTHNLILYLISKLEMNLHKNKYSNAYIRKLLDNTNDTLKRNITLSLFLTLIESFGIVYISISFILSKYLNNISNNNVLVGYSLLISLLALIIVSIIFKSIDIILHKFYYSDYKPSKILLNRFKLMFKFIRLIVVIILKLLKVILIIIYRFVNNFLGFILSIYKLNRIMIKKHPSPKLLENNLINVIKTLMNVDKKERTHFSLVFLYTWAISSNLKMRLGLGINKKKIIKEMSYDNNPSYKIDFIVLSSSHLLIPYSNNYGDRFFFIDPRVCWNNKRAKKYVLDSKINFKCHKHLDEQFKRLVEDINK